VNCTIKLCRFLPRKSFKIQTITHIFLGPDGFGDNAVGGKISWRNCVEGSSDVTDHQVGHWKLSLAAAVAKQRL
jgi:hypothetical protein